MKIEIEVSYGGYQSLIKCSDFQEAREFLWEEEIRWRIKSERKTKEVES